MKFYNPQLIKGVGLLFPLFGAEDSANTASVVSRASVLRLVGLGLERQPAWLGDCLQRGGMEKNSECIDNDRGGEDWNKPMVTG